MPGKTAVTYGNEIFDGLLFLPSVPVPAVSSGALGTNTVNVPGVLPFDLISWNLTAPPTNGAIDNIFVSAPNTLTILWSATGGALSAGNTPLLIEVIRADGYNLGAQAIPSALV